MKFLLGLSLLFLSCFALGASSSPEIIWGQKVSEAEISKELLKNSIPVLWQEIFSNRLDKCFLERIFFRYSHRRLSPHLDKALCPAVCAVSLIYLRRFLEKEEKQKKIEGVGSSLQNSYLIVLSLVLATKMYRVWENSDSYFDFSYIKNHRLLSIFSISRLPLFERLFLEMLDYNLVVERDEYDLEIGRILAASGAQASSALNPSS